jgi:uncharacterized protein involved in type VI secretion and phage assembly
MCVIKLLDDEFKLTDSTNAKIGNTIEVSMGQSQSTVAVVFKGEIVAIDMEIGQLMPPYITLQCYNKMHRLQTGRKTRSFLNVSDSDMVGTIAGEAGLSAQATSTGTVYEYILQNNESNLEFLQRRAQRTGYELYVDDTRLVLRKRTTSTKTATLEYGIDLMSFSMRRSAHGQVGGVTVRGWDVAKKQAIVGTAASSEVAVGDLKGTTDSALFGTNKMLAVYAPIFNQAEAGKVAQAVLDEISSRHMRVEGSCFGIPAMKPGTTVEVKKIGATYSGTYYLTACIHRYDMNGYVTEFEASGSQPTDLYGLTQNGTLQPEQVPGVIIGVVTNNKDPEKNWGRVKVKFPTMPQNNGAEIESTWARIAMPSAGKGKGFMFLPEVNDEVVVAFEQGDINRPYVVGVLWNGTDATPETAANAVGSDGIVIKSMLKTRTGHTILFDEADDKSGISIIDKSTKNKFLIDTTNNVITMDTEKDVEIKALKGNVTVTASDSAGTITLKGKKVLLDATDIELKASNSVKITGVNIEAKANADIKLEGTASAKLHGTNMEVSGSASGKVDGGAMLEVKGGLVKIN